MQCFLVIALFQLALPDRGASNLATFADKDITWDQAESNSIMRAKVHHRQIRHVNVAPLHITVPQVGSRMGARLATC
jgi:hypothetical protein